MISINNRIFSKKINNKVYFGFDKITYLIENKQVKCVESEIPEEVKGISLIEESKDNIIDNGNSYVFVDGDGNEFEANKSTKEVTKNGEKLSELDEIDSETVRIITGLLEYDSSDIESNDDIESIDINGVDEKVSINEIGEPVIEESVEISAEKIEEDESNDAEIKLILDKLDELNSNILKLEDIDMNDRDDVQEVYIQEMGKIGILKKRLDELGHDYNSTSDNIIDKLLENYSYPKLSKISIKASILNEAKIGKKVLDHICNISKTRFLESLSGDKSIEFDGIKIDHSGNDENYVVSGNISHITEESILVVDENDLIKTIEELSNINIGDTDNSAEDIKSIIMNKIDVDSILDNNFTEATLKDNSYYRTKCDLYSDNFDGGISPIMSEHSFLKIPKNVIVRYSYDNNLFYDERGNVYEINPKYIEEFDNVDINNMTIGKMYESHVNKQNLKLVDIVTKNSMMPQYLFENSSGKYITIESNKIPFNLKNTK